MDQKTIEEAAERVIELESELEAAGIATLDADAMGMIRAELHKWFDTVTGVVNSPGVGRVTLIHDNGQESKIASPNLPFLLTQPARFNTGG
jgi:hypothetical protein